MICAAVIGLALGVVALWAAFGLSVIVLLFIVCLL